MLSWQQKASQKSGFYDKDTCSRRKQREEVLWWLDLFNCWFSTAPEEQTGESHGNDITHQFHFATEQQLRMNSQKLSAWELWLEIRTIVSKLPLWDHFTLRPPCQFENHCQDPRLKQTNWNCNDRKWLDTMIAVQTSVSGGTTSGWPNFETWFEQQTLTFGSKSCRILVSLPHCWKQDRRWILHLTYLVLCPVQHHFRWIREMFCKHLWLMLMSVWPIFRLDIWFSTPRAKTMRCSLVYPSFFATPPH